MQENGPTVAITVRLSGATHRALQRLAQQEHRSLAGQAAHLLEQALAVEERGRRALAAGRAGRGAGEARGLGGDGRDAPRAGEEDQSDPDARAPRWGAPPAAPPAGTESLTVRPAVFV